MAAASAAPGEPKLRLVPFASRHITETYLSWLNDKRLMRYSRQRLVSHTRESSEQYLASFQGTPNVFWAVERCSDGRHVGTMTLYVDPLHNTGDLGIAIGYAGTGFGTEAWGLGLEHGFSALRLHKITAGTVLLNEAMIRVFKHWGMLPEGARGQEVIDGKPTEVLLFGILREQWERRAGTARC